MWHRLFTIALLATTVAAADDAEFAFNLFSDIAPVIALFGDQFARQFMSESLTWVDHVVFAMVPLGILTAITAAIRVQGSPVAKAFIGRARENKALAEIELMSSTPGEVCELFNGNSIVRAMGKPGITEFLIFPAKYQSLEADYAKFDQSLGGAEVIDDSCGIESFESANSAKFELMTCKPYTCKSKAWIQEHSATVRKALRNSNSLDRFLKSGFQLFHPVKDLLMVAQRLSHIWSSEKPKQTGSDMELGNRPPSQSPVETTADRNFGKKEKKSITTEGSLPPEGSSNLQLNLSSDYSDHSGLRKGQEIAIAAILGVVLQLGLVAIAAVIAFYLSPASHSLLETKAYGFPCYVAGTVMLSIGTYLCSFIVERSTVEHSLEIVEKSTKDKPFSLLWVQQHQTVNDQTFKGYVLLAGPKRRIITSRRNSLDESSQSKAKELWQFVTLGAAGLAGIGFVAQFMGIRGLAFPCSIAQLGAIILMALIRARIRRRLGRLPVNRVALAGYELDFLATHITFNPNFRTFRRSKIGKEKPFGEEKRPTEFCRWHINTPGSETQDVSLDTSKDPVNVSSPEEIDANNVGNSGTAALGHHESGPSIHEPTHPPSSQQLIRVRERLSNLCRWSSKASKSANALAQSIEDFMDTFYPGDKGQPRSLNWRIKATRRSAEGKPIVDDYIQISVKKGSQEKWKADVGKIDAALSLWMADIEAKRLEKEQAGKDRKTGASDHWRRTRSGNDLTYKYGRLVGDNLKDGVLKRDISWWIDGGLISDQCDLGVRDKSEDGQDTSDQNSQNWRKDVDIVIGTKGGFGNDNASEFGISSTGRLPCILAQHLFSIFIWTVAKDLPKGLLQADIDGVPQVEIEGVHMFDSQSFEQMWFRPRLRHRQLSKIIRQMETHGLGSMNEILLCIIPAFSHMGLLPNQEILKLMPRIRSGHGWVEVAMCHTKLLRRVKEPSNERIEKLTSAAIISAMDFVLLAYEPQDKNTPLSQELDSELNKIITKLVSPELSTFMKKIIPFYHLQCRCEAFARIFRQFLNLEGMAETVAVLEAQDNRLTTYTAGAGDDEFLDEKFATAALGFPKHHFDLVSPLKRYKLDGVTLREASRKLNETPNRLEALDIFGWSVLHYGSVSRARGLSRYFYFDFLTSKDKSGRLLYLQDAFDRNVMHTTAAAIDKDEPFFDDLLSYQTMTSVKHGIYQSGEDGMTPLHLISKAGALYEMKILSEKLGDTMRDLELVLKKDLWHRQALHLACKFGHDQVIVELLKMGARSDQFDNFEKSPVDYFLEAKGIKQSLRPGEEQNSEVPTSKDHVNAKVLTQEERVIFMKFSPKPETEYQHRKILLHIAVDIEDGGTIAELCNKKFSLDARDLSGRTPLHYALAASKVTMAKSLVEAFGADPTIKDSRGVTPLLLSASRGLMDMVTFLVRRNHGLSEKDTDGNTALDMAITHGHEKVAIYLLQLEKRHDSSFFAARNSPLVAACQQGLSQVVPRILDKWPELIGKTGLWDQPPISWACENDHSVIVQQLIAHLEDKPNVKHQVLNQQATGRRNQTPLHFAILSSNPECFNLLLGQPCVKLDIKDVYGRTPVKLAIEAEKMDYVQRLLLDARTSFEERITQIKEWISSASSDAFGSVASEVLRSVSDENLLDEFLLWLLDQIEKINEESLLRSLVSNLKKGSWERFSSPWELVDLFNHVGFKKELSSHNANENGFDEDGWSCVDFVKTFNRKGTFNNLLHYLERKALLISPRATPATLLGEKFRQTVDISTCPSEGHNNCAQVHRVRVVQNDVDVDKVCLRSDHCISAESDYFYFEVYVLAEAPCRWLGIGFCGRDIAEDMMPGWFERSWAYHGDDGLLYIESGDGDVLSPEFGEPGVFGSNHVVGVGLNLKTGQGFCTKNGKRLDMGDVFLLPGERFNYGKLYPCVGFDVTSEGVGLDFVVNFDGSGEHPFQYQEP